MELQAGGGSAGAARTRALAGVEGRPAALRAGGAAVRGRLSWGGADPRQRRRRPAWPQAATSGGTARGGTDQRRRRRGLGRGGSPGRGGTTMPGRNRDTGAGAAFKDQVKTKTKYIDFQCVPKIILYIDN